MLQPNQITIKFGTAEARRLTWALVAGFYCILNQAQMQYKAKIL